MAEATVDVLVLLTVSAFSLLSIAYIGVMWRMRHTFFIALRSPLLACAVGIFLTLRNFSTTAEWIIAWGGRAPKDDGIVDLVGFPLVLAAVGMIIMRAARVLLMYYPNKRNFWKRVTKEKTVFLCMLWAYVIMELVVWSAAAAYGIPKAGNATSTIVAPVALLSTTSAGLLFGRKLVKMDDMCGLGRESLHLGAFMMNSTAVYAVLLTVPMSEMASKYVHVVMVWVSYPPVVWLMVIRPVRKIILHPGDHRGGTHAEYHLLYGVLPWKGSSHVVRVGPAAAVRQTMISGYLASTTSSFSNPLDQIMNFLPLRDAFGEFCRKALCTESFQFLVDVNDFKNSLYRLVDRNDDKKEQGVDGDYERYHAIVVEYVKDNAPSEVNINSHTKKEALRYTELCDFVALSQVEREEIFLAAEKDISHMLADNLLRKFQASAAFKEIVEYEDHQGD